MADVQVRVGAESAGGEEVYETHARGLSRISTGARESIMAFGDARKEMFQYRMSLMAINATLSTVNMLVGLAGIKNEALRKVMIGLNAAVAIGNTILLLRAAYESKVAIATWGRAVANLAASGLLAPVLFAVMSAAVIGALSLQSKAAKPMAQGGYGLVSNPTLFLAGEEGPEAYSFTPMGMGGGISSGGSINVREINVNVYTNDPDELSKAWVNQTRKLKEVLR